MKRMIRIVKDLRERIAGCRRMRLKRCVIKVRFRIGTTPGGRISTRTRIVARVEPGISRNEAAAVAYAQIERLGLDALEARLEETRARRIFDGEIDALVEAYRVARAQLRSARELARAVWGCCALALLSRARTRGMYAAGHHSIRCDMRTEMDNGKFSGDARSRPEALVT